MNINIELGTYKELVSMMHPGKETFDDVLKDLLHRIKSVVTISDGGKKVKEPNWPFAYWYSGEWYICDSGKDLLESALRRISRDNPDFLGKYAEDVNSEGRIRAYVARSREELYPGDSKLQKTAVGILPDGWYLGTNMSNTRKTRMIKSACKVSGMRYGVDLVVKMGR